MRDAVVRLRRLARCTVPCTVLSSDGQLYNFQQVKSSAANMSDSAPGGDKGAKLPRINRLR
jgi:hypothetical protein